MVTWTKARTFKPHHIANLYHVSSSTLYHALFDSKEQYSFKTTTKYLKWFAIIFDEIKSLKLGDT